MQRKPISLSPSDYPPSLHPFLQGADLFDSSCSPEARVLYIERDGGLFLKSAPLGSLQREARMTRYFHEKGLSAEVLFYGSTDGRDYLLTRRVPGEDMTHADVLRDPRRLCDTYADILRGLHALQADDCPVRDRTADYLQTAEENYRRGMFDPSYSDTPLCAEDAYRILCENRQRLKNDVLIHGDYCLPNVILKDFVFSGFIDLGGAGLGDRHIDLFWGIWTLAYNLKTDAYRDRFLDAYGRADIDTDLLSVIGAIETFG